MATIYVECPSRPRRTLQDLHEMAGHGHADEDLVERRRAVIVEPNSTLIIFCGTIDPEPMCACGHTAEMLCDYPMGRGKTCDLPVCWCCSRSIGQDKDLCLIHHAEFVRKTGVARINPWPPKRCT